MATTFVPDVMTVNNILHGKRASADVMVINELGFKIGRLSWII